MKNIFFICFLFFVISFNTANAQNSFSFSCAKDTLITDCSVSCITLKTKLPNIRSSTSSYSVNPMSGAGGCFVPYVDPSLPGNPTNLTIDDRYSSVINLPFSFLFYGASYNSLVASTNGYLSFDASLAGGFSHWSMTPGNIPNTGYDRALIMGVFHDIDPSVTTSPTMRIKYDILGAAPHRKFILSFYKAPLFSAACNNLIENTHQIVIYEGLGLVEVFVNGVQQCPGWNSGRKMIGMQNFNRDAAIMAPGRAALDPAWGTTNMNESWRFVPSGGATLYRSVKLYDLAGNLVSTGDTTSLSASTFSVSFPNVCPTQTTTYVVKSTYQQIDNPTGIITGTDTIRVVRETTFSTPSAVTNILCNGNNTGSITVTPLGGVGPFQYAINGGAFQTNNVFSNLVAGAYSVKVKDNSNGCTRDTIINVTQPNALAATTTAQNATCSATPNGVITVTPTGGVSPYTYSINGTTFQSGNTFLVNSNNYVVTIKDANQCITTKNVAVGLTNNLTLQSRADTNICAGIAVPLTTVSNAAAFSWTPSAGLSSATAQSPIATPTVPTDYIVTATLGQCSKKDTVKIFVDKQLNVNAGADVSIIKGDEVILQGNVIGATSYVWTPSTALSATNTLSPVAKPLITTLYTLTAQNSIGCKESDDVLVTVIPYCIKVKNAFTPNGDGNNDVWQIYDQFDCLKNISVQVFNRYGSKVFESRDYRNNWDGTYKGNPVPDGTYYTVINFTLVTGKVLIIKSDITILR